MSQPPRSSLELQSAISADGLLSLQLVDVPLPDLGPNDVLLRVEAAPLNPSDLGLLLGPADLTSLRAGGSPDRPTVTARVPAERMAGVAGRIGQSLPVGNEGAGTIVAAGERASELIGKPSLRARRERTRITVSSTGRTASSCPTALRRETARRPS